MKVDVYKNLHNGKWSVLNRKHRRLYQHADQFVVRNATFVVQPAGRKKVIEEQRKNVHAFVRGTYGSPHFVGLDKADFPIRISYNPYKADHFIRTDTGEKVTESTSLHGLVLLDSDGAWMQSEPYDSKTDHMVNDCRCPNGHDEICPTCKEPIHYVSPDDFDLVSMDENDEAHHEDCLEVLDEDSSSGIILVEEKKETTNA